MTSNEERNVVQRVIVGHGKYREYRLSNHLFTDRSPLWPSKHEVGELIAEILKSRKSEIHELKRRLKLLEEYLLDWVLIAKVVNRNNENFFLDVVSASPEEIAKFEKENFGSKRSWAKHRDVSELTEKEIQELLSSESDDNKSSKENVEHYEWICRMLSVLTSSYSENVNDEQCSLENPGTTRVLAEVQAEISAKAPIDASKVVFLAEEDSPVLEPNIEDPPSPILRTDNATKGSKPTSLSDQDLVKPIIQETIPPKQLVEKSDRAAVVEFDKEKDATAEKKCNGEVKKRPTPTSECHSDNVVKDSVAGEKKGGEEENDENQLSLKNDTCSEVYVGSGPVEIVPFSLLVQESLLTGQHSSAVQVENEVRIEAEDDQKKVEVTDKTDSSSDTATQSLELSSPEVLTATKPTSEEPSLPSATNPSPTETTLTEPTNATSGSPPSRNPAADLSGYSKLGLTSTRAFKQSIPPATSTQPKISSNIWEQRAQERKEKLVAERQLQQQPPPAAPLTPRTEVKIPNNNRVVEKLRTTKSQGPPPNILVAKPSSQEKEQNKKETPKPAENGGWITFANKKGKNIGLFSPELERTDNTVIISRSQLDDLSNRPTDSPQSNCTPKLTTSRSSEPVKTEICEKAASTNEVTKLEDEDIKAEKRAKRRQRKQDKIKQNKEEEKKVKELKRIEYETNLQKQKKEKEDRHEREFKQKQLEMKKIRQERERMEHRKSMDRMDRNNAGNNERVKMILATKERLEQHLQEKNVAYRVISSKIYIDLRLTELIVANQQHINKTKFEMLEKFQKRISASEITDLFLAFTSHTLEEKESKFQLKELLDYMTSSSFRGKPISPEHEVIQKAFDAFQKTKKLNTSDAMEISSKFFTKILKEFSEMGDKRTPQIIQCEKTLSEYKHHFDEVFTFIGITSYLRTRTETEFFLCEEDSLMVATEPMENCESQKCCVKEEPEIVLDECDEDYEQPEVQDMSCQTDGEPYDLRAASFLPRDD
ncbi:hypothetical protein L3Y34_012003 [Caenorhabditis briggsae]|uniref:Uncharacterized protein n=1 Tax=Caenorhabditis briggsae TaxID=6238 RepID=A0AAE8ZRH4_CAEBR|nr:hypothetical protein L3Y34_012003 [Caenorhabditis briggsae]